MLVSSAFMGRAHVRVMNLEETIAVERSVGEEGVFWNTTSPERGGEEEDVSRLKLDGIGPPNTDDFISVRTADFDRDEVSPSNLCMQLFRPREIKLQAKKKEKKEKRTLCNII